MGHSGDFLFSSVSLRTLVVVAPLHPRHPGAGLFGYARTPGHVGSRSPMFSTATPLRAGHLPGHSQGARNCDSSQPPLSFLSHRVPGSCSTMAVMSMSFTKHRGAGDDTWLCFLP